MTTIDRNGDLHAGDGKYTNKRQAAAGYDLAAGAAAPQATQPGRPAGTPIGGQFDNATGGGAAASLAGDEPDLVTAHYGDPDTPIPDGVAAAIATYHYGAKGYVVPGPATKTKWSSDGGGYTLHGTRIAGADGEHALVYRKETGEYVVEHYDGSGSTWRDNGDGTLTKRDWYGGQDTTIAVTPGQAETDAESDDDPFADEPHECPFCDAYGCRAAQTGQPADCQLNERLGYHGDQEDGGRERELLAMEDEVRAARDTATSQRASLRHTEHSPGYGSWEVEPVQFDDVVVGDTLRLTRIYRGFEYQGGESKRFSVTVAKVTANTVTTTDGLRFTRAKWHEANPVRIVDDPPDLDS